MTARRARLDVDDSSALSVWPVGQKIAQDGRICIFGSGWYGGYAALMGAAREPDL